MMKKIGYYTLLLLFPFISGFSQETEDESMVTDRPDQTESSVTVPKNTLQWESGFLFEKATSLLEENTSISYSSNLFRYGLFDVLELRLGISIDQLTSETKSSGEKFKESGIAPISLGTKVYLGKQKGWIPELAVLAHIDLAKTGNNAFHQDHSVQSTRLAASHEISDRFSLGYNLGFSWSEKVNEGEVFYSLSTAVSLADNWGVFFEPYGFLYDGMENKYMVDAGTTYLLKSNFQLDFSAGIGINEAAPDYFMGFGFSYRIPR